jgi:cytochrome c peroxidase
MAYQDGLVAPVSLVPGKTLHRNTPSLLYAPLAARLTGDGRMLTADRQALSVIHTDAEMGLGDDELAKVLASNEDYATRFRAAFGREVRPEDVGTALAAFEAQTLVVGRAPIDRFARTGSGLTSDARAGLDVFAGKGRCARCHVPPVWGGTRPPDFKVAVFSVLGVPSAPGSHELDPDPGRGGVTHQWADAHAFKVPTLRNIAKTAPYFHHGAFPTLEGVLDFYDQGGGRGAGLRVPNQDPDIRPLHLSAEEKRLLLAFMREALSDEP